MPEVVQRFESIWPERCVDGAAGGRRVVDETWNAVRRIDTREGLPPESELLGVSAAGVRRVS